LSYIKLNHHWVLLNVLAIREQIGEHWRSFGRLLSLSHGLLAISKIPEIGSISTQLNLVKD
jgi:hypothetical protein